MEKYLILGEVYENKKVYAIFYTGEYFICDLSKIKAIQKPTTTDLKIIRKLNDTNFKKKILAYNDNYWLSTTIEHDNKEILVSNIKCYKNPSLISYQYEQFKSLYLKEET